MWCDNESEFEWKKENIWITAAVKHAEEEKKQWTRWKEHINMENNAFKEHGDEQKKLPQAYDSDPYALWQCPPPAEQSPLHFTPLIYLSCPTSCVCSQHGAPCSSVSAQSFNGCTASPPLVHYSLNLQFTQSNLSIITSAISCPSLISFFLLNIFVSLTPSDLLSPPPRLSSLPLVPPW